MDVVIDAVNLRIEFPGHRDLGRGKEKHRGEARAQMVAEGGVHLDPVFGHDDGHRPLGRRGRRAGDVS